MKKTRNILLILLCICVISCNPSESINDNFSDGRIVPGKSINGILLGDSKKNVISKLGEKATVGSLSDGLYRSWFTDEYLQGTYAGLTINYIEIENQLGPVDMIEVLPPYSGQTKEGIGIGSTFNDVRKIYGIPNHTYSKPLDQFIVDSYCFNGRHLEIHYKRDSIIAMSIGYFYPLAEDTMNICK